MPHRSAATLIGFVAILLWSSLAVLTAWSGPVPPFQLVAMSFAVGGLIGLVPILMRPSRVAALRQKPVVWLVGVGGLFGYHALYFTALKTAPAVEASLINYLWPLLIIVFSAALPGEKLRPHHLVGAGLGLVGAALIVTGGRGFSFQSGYLLGYGAALAAALVWSSYSVVSRRFQQVPTLAVTGFCLVTSLLATLCHLVFETTIWPATPLQWAATLLLGIGPVGLAFFFWDHGVKRGDIQVLGAAAYAAPLLSTFNLIVFGIAAFTPAIGIAAALITLGAVIAAWDMIFRRRAGQG